MTSIEDQLAPPDTVLGQLQRGRGRGWLTARRAHDGQELLEACLARDPRWDSQVESRAVYYARLALAIGFPASRIDPDALEDEDTRWLLIDVLGELAERGDESALALMRDRLTPGPLAEHLLWRLAGLSGRRGLAGLLNLIVDRFDDEQLRELICERPKYLPWEEWAETSDRVRLAVRSVDEERERSRGGARPSPPPVDAPLSVILDHDWGPIPPRALTHRLVNLATPDEVEAIRDAATCPSEPRRRLPMFVLGKRRDPSLVSVAVDVFARGVGGRERISACRYLSELDPSVTLPIARKWITAHDDRQSMASGLMALHAEAADAPHIREALQGGLRAKQMYLVCDLVDALARLAGTGPFPELRTIFEQTAYSYARRRAALAMKVTDPEFTELYATECLWDCEAQTREVGASSAPATTQVIARLRDLSGDRLERASVVAAAEHRLRALEPGSSD